MVVDSVPSLFSRKELEETKFDKQVGMAMVANFFSRKLAIINDAMVGLQRSGTKYAMEPDRRAAIALAIREAGPGDIVLIAGKGHEKVQVSREGTIPFDDVEVAQQLLHDAGYECSDAEAASAVGKKP